MTRNPSGLFKTSVKCVIEAFAHNALFRNWSIGLTLLAATAGVPLALAGPEAQADVGRACTLALALVLLPLEFRLYDLVLMVRPAKTTARGMLFDSRLPAYLWRMALLILVFFTPQFIVRLAFSPALAPTADPGPAVLLAALLGLLLWIVLLPPLLRVMFFPVALAAGRPKPVRTSFRRTKGKLWRIFRAMFLPMLFLSILYGALLLLPTLFARAGTAAYAAGWAAAVAGIILVTSVETAFFALVYRRIVEPGSYSPAAAPLQNAAETADAPGTAGVTAASRAL